MSNTPTSKTPGMLKTSATPARDLPRLAPGMVAEINRLHTVVQRSEQESRQALNGALSAAWHAGKLLSEARASIRHHAGRGAWTPWVQTCFSGNMRTAQRYMKLARSAEAPTHLPGLSLRQAYFALGIAIEPKEPAVVVGKLSAHVVLANKLTRVLRRMRRKINTQDLAPLYDQLRALFENHKGQGPGTSMSR